MKILRKTTLIAVTLILLSCNSVSNVGNKNPVNLLTENDSLISEDYWPFSKTLVKHDPFVSELLDYQ